MTGMEHAIEQATEAIRHARAFQAAAAFGVPEGAHRECAEYIARALADAGLLAPAPFHEEWASASDGDAWTCCGDRDEAEVRRCAVRQGHEVVHRYATDWAPADGISRAEGDGRADL